jgi:hypothetical protein
MYEGIVENVYTFGGLSGEMGGFFKASLETSCTHLTKTSQNVLDTRLKNNRQQINTN